MVSGRGNRRLRALASVAAVGAIVASLLAVAPVAALEPGDELVSAVPIATIGVAQAYDTAAATSDASDPTSCESQTSGTFDGPFTNTFWHSFMPASSGELFVDVNSFPDPNADGFLAIAFVFTDDGQGGLELVGCNAFPATVDITAEAGRTYYVMTGSLPETPVGGPALITVMAPFVSGLTVDTKAAYDPRTHLVTVSGTVDCATPADAFIDVSGQQRVGNKRVFGGGGSEEPIPCDGPTPWRVTIGGQTSFFNPGVIDVVVDATACIDFLCDGDEIEDTVKAQPVSNKPSNRPPPPPPPPANDEQANAVALVVDGAALTADTRAATVNPDTDPQECPFAGFPPSSHTVWYTVTPDADGWVEVNTFGSDYDTTLYVLDAGSVIACNDDALNVQSRVKFHVTAGTTYAVMSGTFDESPGGNLVIAALTTAAPPPPPANDERAGAFPIALAATLDQDASGATAGQGDPLDCPDQFGAGPSPTVWYRFTAPDDGFVQVDASESDYPTFVFILDGDTVVACSDSGSVTFATTSGTAYDIDIGAFSQSAGNLTLSVTAAEEPPPPPAPVELTLVVDPTAALDPKTGEATITGTATCTLPAEGGLFVALFQEGGRFDAEGFADGSLSCNTEPTAFSIPVTSDTTKFVGGIAQLHVEAFVETEEGAGDFRLVDTDVRLRPAGSKH